MELVRPTTMERLASKSAEAREDRLAEDVAFTRQNGRVLPQKDSAEERQTGLKGFEIGIQRRATLSRVTRLQQRRAMEKSEYRYSSQPVKTQSAVMAGVEVIPVRQ